MRTRGWRRPNTPLPSAAGYRPRGVPPTTETKLRRTRSSSRSTPPAAASPHATPSTCDEHNGPARRRTDGGENPHQANNAADDPQTTPPAHTERITVRRSPALVLSDFSAAFPSLGRKFVAHASDAMHVAPGVKNVIKAMYAPSWSYVGRPDARSTPGFRVATGAPQECPLSGTRFPCATVALILMLIEVVGADQIFLFADDIAIIVFCAQLDVVRGAFDEYRTATSLTLKDEKCVLAPLLRSTSDTATCEIYHRLLADAVLAWQRFRVEMQATYLGVSAGPGVSPDERWKKPIQKFVARASELARSPLSPAAVVRHIQVYAVPVLTCAAMLSAPHAAAMHAEALVWQRALRFPHRALPLAAIGSLHEIGLAKARPLKDVLLGGLTRSSHRHAEDVSVASSNLDAARESIGWRASMVRQTDWNGAPLRTLIVGGSEPARMQLQIVPRCERSRKIGDQVTWQRRSSRDSAGGSPMP